MTKTNFSTRHQTFTGRLSILEAKLSKEMLGKIFLFTLFLALGISSPLYAEEGSESSTETTASEETSGEDTATEESSDDSDEQQKPKVTLTTKDWSEIKRPRPSSDRTKIDLLLKEVDDREVLKLQAGDEEFIGLFLEYNTAQPLGAVLILHDEDSHPDNNRLIAPLRKYLPDYGWNTLAIAIPEADTTPLPERKWPKYPADFTLNPPEADEEADESDTEANENEANENKESTDSADTGSDTSTEDSATSEAGTDDSAETASKDSEDDKPSAQEITMQRIGSAVQELINRGQLNIVIIGQGIGASWAVSYLESSSEQQMFTLVMINPKLPTTETDKDFINTRLGEFGNLPILDIVSQSNELPKRQAKERSNIARRKQLPAFQQLFTRPVNDPWTEHHRIVKRVRGWLAQNAPGEEQPIQ
ncbi:DUF3530 family protein [Litoribrevibacter euphylliae]|uniref:DUF3530 family protein n=1 Tax=Litoribrevibacter euphylliae TaxID=1834034 RepID=A0ABV7HA44_9GAMM